MQRLLTAESNEALPEDFRHSPNRELLNRLTSIYRSFVISCAENPLANKVSSARIMG